MMGGDSVREAQPLFQMVSGGAIPTSPLQLEFKEIGYKTAMEVVVREHYLHRRAPTSWSYGAYYDGFLEGVITVGKPASHTLQKGVAGRENAHRVFELNRLWLSDNMPRNSESRFIGWVLRKLPKETILVSYADTKYGHIGKVYQATNWIYTGTSIPFTDYTYGNLDHRSVPKDKRDKSKMRKVVRSIKHRYVYFCNGDSSELMWESKPYPKSLSQQREKGKE